MKKYLILFVCILFCFFPTYASKIDAIKLEKISKSSSFLSLKEDLKSYEEYLKYADAENWWFPVEKETISFTVNELKKQALSALKKKKKNYEASLFLVLLETYRLSLGETSFDSVCTEFENLKASFKGEYRTSWFYGIFLCTHKKVYDGSKEFFYCVPKDENDLSIPFDYFTDKATVLYLSGCIKNAFYAYEYSAKRQQKLPDEIFPLYSLKKMKQLLASNVNEEYSPLQTWIISKANDTTFSMTSYLAGYSTLVPGTWGVKLQDIGFKNRMVPLVMQLPTCTAKDGASYNPIMYFLTMYFPIQDSWQNSDDFVADRIQNVPCKQSTINVNGKEWKTYEVFIPEQATSNGGYHGILLILDCPKPGNAISKIDKPLADIDEFASLFCIQDRIDEPYSLCIMLDCVDEFFEDTYKTLIEFMNLLTIQ